MNPKHRRSAMNLFAVLALSTPVLAHGFVLPPPPPAPPPFSGARGGGDAIQGGDIGNGGGGQTEDPFGGATGGGGVGGTTPAGGGSTPRPGAPAPAGGARMGGSSGPSKAKSVSAVYESKITIPWKTVFLPTLRREGYAGVTGSIADGVSLPAAEGGWARDARPTIVLVSDPANADHARAVAGLNADSRFRSAACFFNCFRVDVTSADKQNGDAKIYVYTTEGALIGDVPGQRRFGKALDLLENAWKRSAKSELGGKLPEMDYLLKTKAFVEYRVKQIESAVVCPDCGHERNDVIEEMAKLKLRATACETAMTTLRQMK